MILLIYVTGSIFFNGSGVVKEANLLEKELKTYKIGLLSQLTKQLKAGLSLSME